MQSQSLTSLAKHWSLYDEQLSAIGASSEGTFGTSRLMTGNSTARKHRISAWSASTWPADSTIVQVQRSTAPVASTGLSWSRVPDSCLPLCHAS